jgi:hypothetical protein
VVWLWQRPAHSVSSVWLSEVSCVATHQLLHGTAQQLPAIIDHELLGIEGHVRWVLGGASEPVWLQLQHTLSSPAYRVLWFLVCCLRLRPWHDAGLVKLSCCCARWILYRLSSPSVEGRAWGGGGACLNHAIVFWHMLVHVGQLAADLCCGVACILGHILTPLANLLS